MWRKGPIYREEYPEYPIRAVEEAIVNALIHRDYGVVGSEIHIDIFDDRLEIYSPGGMYNGTLIQDKELNDVPSCRRNPILADIFGRMGLMERRGSGLRKIVESYEREEMYDEKHKPRFKSTKNEFFTILKNLNYDLIQESKKDEVKIIETKMTVEERLKKIINAVSENPTISKSELAKCLNVAESTVKRDIVKLREDGRIDYQGGSKQGKWVKK